MRVIVTRPEQDARRWAARLAQAGHDPVVLPLIDIAPLSSPAARAALADAWMRLGSFRAVMFVSANAAEHFFAARPREAARPWPAHGPRAWAPGPGTVQALVALGVPHALVDGPAADAGQFDSEALWAQVAAQVRPGDSVLFVRGADAAGLPRGRDWLARQLPSAGAVAREVVAYARLPPQADSVREACEAALREAGAPPVWLFSSSEAVANLQALLPRQGWHGARAIATHPRIAQAARDAGFGRVDVCAPGWDAVLASIESAR